jgi:hypothetical protein
MTEYELRAAERGAWFAFDAVLSWINTQPRQFIDKKELYRAVMQMRPGELAALAELRL